MPVFRWKAAIGVARGLKAYLDLEAGVTRTEAPVGARPKIQKREDGGQLEEARKQIEEQRRMLESKNLEINRLRMQLSATKASKEDGDRSPGSAVRGALPDFLIIGAQKAGTTYLYHLLCQHPDVEPAVEKEVQYFSVRFGKGLDWYKSHFPASEGDDGRRIVTGEASPYYIYHPHAARRAAEAIPQAKIIALLRNPVDRAYSDYQHKVREGREPLESFVEAIEAEPKRLRGERERMLSDESYVGKPYRRYSYLSRGVYVDQLTEWSKHFSRDQLLVLKSEDLFERSPQTLRRVFEFLGLSYHEPDPSGLRNEGDYAPMSPAARRRLEEFFEPHNRRLYEFLGEDLGW